MKRTLSLILFFLIPGLALAQGSFNFGNTPSYYGAGPTGYRTYEDPAPGRSGGGLFPNLSWRRLNHLLQPFLIYRAVEFKKNFPDDRIATIKVRATAMGYGLKAVLSPRWSLKGYKMDGRISKVGGVSVTDSDLEERGPSWSITSGTGGSGSSRNSP